MNTTTENLSEESKKNLIYNYIKYNVVQVENDLSYYKVITKAIYNEFVITRNEAELYAFEYIRDRKNAEFNKTNCMW